MTNFFLIVFGAVEFVLRVVAAVLPLCVPVFIMVDDDTFMDYLHPYLWEILDTNISNRK